MKFIVEVEFDDVWTDEDVRYFLASDYFDVISYKRVEE